MAGAESSKRKTFIWTALSGCVYALSSVIFLIVVTRRLGDIAAGVYTTASIIAMQLITVGKFSVRNFQISDVKQEFTFSEYFSYRIFTCIIMLLGIIAWGLLGGYRGETLVFILCFGIYKICDAISDVFEGHLQQQMRLDLAGICQCSMNVVLIGVFVVALLVSNRLMFAGIALAVASVCVLIVMYGVLHRMFPPLKPGLSPRVAKRLFLSCSALCLSSFLYSFVNNFPRIALTWRFPGDAGLETLGVFSQIFMPVFVVDLLAGFTLRTWMVPMAKNLELGNAGYLRRKIRIQLAIIAGITLAACVFAGTLGCIVLGWLYHTDLRGYEVLLMILMLAGGFVAVQTLYENIITIYRGQKYTIIINLVAVICGSAVTWYYVYVLGITGAACGFLLMTVLRALGAAIVAHAYLKNAPHTAGTERDV